ncbi:MAG: hypothetical protein JF614_30785 [Acidobacteria bacterium]|nr:hypothetical protein [Acidobacteriota bacterium]
MLDGLKEVLQLIGGAVAITGGGILPDASRASISWDDICTALSRVQCSCATDTEIFVRDCFDWFFYFVDRIELYIEAGLIARRDVEMVFQPYAAIISEKKTMFSDFMEFHGYRLAMGYFKQYDGGPSSKEREGG